MRYLARLRHAWRFAPLWLAWGLAGALCLSCGPRHTGLRPEVVLATSSGAQAEFRLLRERWTSTAPDARPELERELTSFIQRYPEDPAGRWARIYLAWIRLQLGDIPLAERWLGLADVGPSGAATDLSDVVHASIDLAAGRAPLAYAKLEALEPRVIDADDRLLCLDRLVLASLAVARYPEAVHQMLELGALAARRHRERVWRAIEPRLSEVPLAVLEASLPRVTPDAVESPSVRPAERAAAAEWLRRQILQVLSQNAISRQDVGLAQRLVATDPATESASNGHTQLLWLATQGGLSPMIAGRTLGLALELGDTHLRQRSMQVAGAITETLERAPRAPNQTPVQLETRQVEGEAMEDALARLAGDGAALLVAGLDPHAARLAADFAARHAIPVLLLTEPEDHPASLPTSAYLIGTNDTAADELLRRSLEARVDALITLGANDAACSAESNSENSSAALLETQVRRPGVLFVGEAECSASVLAPLRGSERRWTLGLGLRALGVASGDLGVRELWTLSTGRLASAAATDPDFARWLRTRGHAPGWYEALGHDIARLAQASIPAAPAAPVRDPASVAETHRRVARALEQAELTDAWTSDGSRLGDDRRMPRQFRVVPGDSSTHEPQRAEQPLKQRR